MRRSRSPRRSCGNVPGHEGALATAVKGEGIYLTGWSLLTLELRRVIPGEFIRAVLAVGGILVVLLALAFRDWKALALFVAATSLVFACLLGAMSLLGMSWNVFNLASLLLLIGTGTDYSILLLLALRRNGGEEGRERRAEALVVGAPVVAGHAGVGAR